MSAAEEIKERLDVVDVISAYVPLRKSGRIYKALCPFHQEKTPSFVVYPDTGTWRCFGACGTGGDIFAFVMKRENVDFREALEIMARKAGVSLVAAGSTPSPHDQHIDRLREISYSAAIYFHNQLRQSAQGQDARDYLDKRGFDNPTIDSFLLGYAPDSWDGLLRTLHEKNYQTDDILAAGLIIERQHEQTGRVSTYDRFRHRVMIPIRDVQGHVIGFGARALRSDQQPKYLNSPQSPLFDKSSVLFGLDAAHKAIRARDQAIIVEGYMDVLACHQFGETNVVASMGTALTEPQLKSLKRYTNTFILALDADTAGQAATLRGIEQARESLDREWVPTLSAIGLVQHEARLAADLRIMTLPEGQDPDDVVRAAPERWRALVQSARPAVDYFFDLVRRDLDLSTAQGKSEAVDRLAPLIREVANEVQRAHYVQQLARLIQTDERTVERLVLQRRPPAAASRQAVRIMQPPDDLEDAEPSEVDQAGKAGSPPINKRPVAGAGKGLTSSPATHSLALLVLHPDLLPDLQTELARLGMGPIDEDDFGQSEERAICSALLAGRIGSDGEWPDADTSVAPLLAKLRSFGHRWPKLSRQELLKDAVDSVLRLRIDALKSRSRLLSSLARDAKSEPDPAEVLAYRQILNELKVQLHVLEQALNNRTYAGRRQTAPSL
jgi:DNA primase